MKRKVSRIGPATLCVSLPSKWAKGQGIKKGDEVEVIEEASKLLISGKAARGHLKISLNVAGIPELLYRVIGALYKAGYDEIELFYQTPQELGVIQKELSRTCAGFELVEQTKNKVMVKRISQLEVEEFDTILKRCFFSLLSMAEDSAEAVRNQDRQLMEKVILCDDSVNRYSDFCRRIINKGLYDKERPAPTYFIVESLEKIGDMYRDLMRYALKENVKMSTEVLKLHNEVNQFLREYYALYYNFDLKKTNEFVAKKKKHQPQLLSSLAGASKKEVVILYYLNAIFNAIFDLNGALLTTKI